MFANPAQTLRMCGSVLGTRKRVDTTQGLQLQSKVRRREETNNALRTQTTLDARWSKGEGKGLLRQLLRPRLGEALERPRSASPGFQDGNTAVSDRMLHRRLFGIHGDSTILDRFREQRDKSPESTPLDRTTVVNQAGCQHHELTSESEPVDVPERHCLIDNVPATKEQQMLMRQLRAGPRWSASTVAVPRSENDERWFDDHHCHGTVLHSSRRIGSQEWIGSHDWNKLGQQSGSVLGYLRARNQPL